VLSLEAMMISVILSICGFVTSMTTSAALKLLLRQTLLFYQFSLSIGKTNPPFRGHKLESQASRCVASGNFLAQKCQTSTVSCLGVKRLEDLVSVSSTWVTFNIALHVIQNSMCCVFFSKSISSFELFVATSINVF